jgi:hypothetical protein
MIRALNEQYLAALRANDAGWFEGHLADDALVVLGDGRRLRKGEFLAEVRGEARRFRAVYAVNVSLRTFGAMVQVDADAPWELDDGQRGVSRYIDTWAYLDGRWQVVSAQVTAVPSV